MARRRWGTLTTLFIRWFVRRYGVDLDEAVKTEPSDYGSFADFFTRGLRDGARTWPTGGTNIACPVDGVASMAGEIRANTLVQAKLIDYPLQALIGAEPTPYVGGHFATLYLRPQDYHRVHVPIGGQLTGIRHIRGRLWPVRPWAVAGVPGLFARNERGVLEFAGDTGPWALVMVGAMMVGSMETVVTGRIHGRRRQPDYWNLKNAACHFERGDEIGRFHFGSTVILLFGPGQMAWNATALTPGYPVRLGQSIGNIKT